MPLNFHGTDINGGWRTYRPAVESLKDFSFLFPMILKSLLKILTHKKSFKII